MTRVRWTRHTGYECSTRGDRRFSALNARMPDGRSIEMHYQCDVKGYDPGGNNWKLGKSKPPISGVTDLWGAYLALWRDWARRNPKLIEDLRRQAARHDNTLCDAFATSNINQAAALAQILNETAEVAS